MSRGVHLGLPELKVSWKNTLSVFWGIWGIQVPNVSGIFLDNQKISSPQKNSGCILELAANLEQQLRG